MKLCCETCSVFKLDNIKNVASQRDLLNFCIWQHQKRSTSARLPICFKVHNIKNEAILRDVLQKRKVERSLVPMCFAIFPVHLSKLLHLPQKVMPCHTKRCTCHAKSSQQTWRSDAPKCNTSQEINARTSGLTALQNMPLVLRLPRKMHLCRSSSNVPRLPSFLEMLQNPHVLLTFDQVHNPVRLPPDMTSERPKVARTCGAFNHLTSTCAKHLNFQKWSEAEVFCTFWLAHVLRATTACNFSSLIWPAGSAPAALASLLFDPPEPQIIGKTQCFTTFLPFRAPASSFFWLFLFSDLLSSALLSSTLLFSLTLPISAFHLSILSEVWLLNFLR